MEEGRIEREEEIVGRKVLRYHFPSSIPQTLGECDLGM